jgi:hypothetical protein
LLHNGFGDVYCGVCVPDAVWNRLGVVEEGQALGLEGEAFVENRFLMNQ